MGTKLPYSVEQKAVRDSLEYSDRMKSYEASKHDGDWGVIKLGAVVVGLLACAGFVLYSLVGVLR